MQLVAKGCEGKERQGMANLYKRERDCLMEGEVTASTGKDMKEWFIRDMHRLPYLDRQYNNYKVRTLQELMKVSQRGGKLVIYGCGGHSRSVVNTVYAMQSNVEIILVDDNARKDEIILGCRTEREYELTEKDAYIVAIGNNVKRKKMYQKLLKHYGEYCISIISQSANVGIAVQVGRGTFIGANVYIGSQATIGSNTIINTGSVIEHEVQVGDNTHIAPHVTICGRTKVGNNVFCGAGSIIIDSIKICDDVIIGAGTVVKDNIFEPGTYVGIPAKRIK